MSILPCTSSAFVCHMEDVFHVYQRLHDSAWPMVCFDDGAKQLVKDVAAPIAATLQPVEIIDFEYERHSPGTS